MAKPKPEPIRLEMRQAKHTITGETCVVEMWEGEEFVGVIYPSPGGVRIISKHLALESITFEETYPQALNVKLTPRTESKSSG